MAKLALIGFGEAGFSFACAAGWQGDAAVYDICDRAEAIAAAGVTSCRSAGEAVAHAPVVLSLVTADAALRAAMDAAPGLMPGTLYIDMNSVAPTTKSTAAAVVEAAGARYVDAAIMAPVNPARMAVPILLSGHAAAEAQQALAGLGFAAVRIAGGAVGRASTIKMLRSVMYKGVEALTAECLAACQRAGVVDEVLGSFLQGSAGKDWAEGADYRIDRMMVHGERRAAEMLESARTLESLGVAPLMTRGTIEHQARIGRMGIKAPPEGLAAKLEIIAK